MTTRAAPAPGTLFTLGWITLLALAALATLGHLALAIILSEEATLFIGWAAFNAYAALVLAVPFRRGERWAWFITWLLAAAFASTLWLDAEFGPMYASVAGLMAVCLLLTGGAFFGRR